MKTCKIRVNATGEIIDAVESPWGWLTSSGLSFSVDEAELVNSRSD